MNPMKLLNPSADNSILITAEFFEDGHRLRLDRSRIHRYELDLIVPDDITLEELVVALGEGICTQLERRYHLQDPNTDPAYLDAVRRFEQLQQRYRALGREFSKQRPRRSPVQFHHHAAISAIERHNAQQLPEEPVPAQEDLWRWLVCLDVFRRCYDHYRRGYPELDAVVRQKVRNKAFPKHPVIACSNILPEDPRREDPIHPSGYYQSWLMQSRHGSRTLRQLGFFSTTRLIFDPNSYHLTPSLLRAPGSSPAEPCLPYRPAARPDVRPVCATVSIDVPRDLEKPVPAGAFYVCGALLLSAAVFLPGAVLLDLLGMGVHLLYYGWLLLSLTAGWCAYRRWSLVRQRRRYRRYEAYIQSILKRLHTLRQENLQLLSDLYPPVYAPEDSQSLLERTFRLEGSIGARRRDQQDFLQVRIGLSREGSRTVPSLVEFQLPPCRETFSDLRYKNIRGHAGIPFRIIGPGESKKFLHTNDGTVGFFNCLAEDIRNAYGWLDHAPVLMDLHRNRALGVYYEDAACSYYPLLNQMLFDVCYHHAPEDVQLVLFCPKMDGIRKRQEFIRQFKQLPHFNGLLEGQSQFVFHEAYASEVMDRLALLCRHPSEGTPHIVMILLEDHGFCRHPLSKLLPAGADQMTPADNGVTFLFFGHSEAALPPYCSHVLKRDFKGHYFCLPYVQRFEPGALQTVAGLNTRYGFDPDPFAGCFLAPGEAGEQDPMYQGFKILSALGQNKARPAPPPLELPREEVKGFQITLTEPNEYHLPFYRSRGAIDRPGHRWTMPQPPEAPDEPTGWEDPFKGKISDHIPLTPEDVPSQPDSPKPERGSRKPRLYRDVPPDRVPRSPALSRNVPYDQVPQPPALSRNVPYDQAPQPPALSKDVPHDRIAGNDIP